MPADKKNKKPKKATKKPKLKPEPTTPATIISAARAAAFTDESPQAAFAHFRPLAEKIPAADLPIFTGQPLVMRANIVTALAALEPYLSAAVEKHAAPDLTSIFELPSIVMGLEFATTRVPVAKLSAGEIDRMLAEGAPWRELMLTYLEVASHPLIALLPRERVAAVRAGTGKLDKAQDFVALPGLFTEFAEALQGKHPFPADKLDLLATLGGTLVQQVRPGNAVAEIAKRSPESILRDRFAALVEARYDHLQVLATVALGKRRADALLPALRSGVAFAAPASQPEPTAPAAGSAAPA